MSILKLALGLGALAGVTIASHVAITKYFFDRTMIRQNARTERTMKMSGVDWTQYYPLINENKEWMETLKRDEITINSRDNLKLRGYYFENEERKDEKEQKTVILFHGYTSQGLLEHPTIARFYYGLGYNILIIDQRSHGDSEGKYIGFGYLERYDGLNWIEYLNNRFSDNKHEILLHGGSMGGATVCMMSGLDLPENVVAIVSDCAFTSGWEVFESVLKNMYHIPAYPILSLAEKMGREKAGFSIKTCNSINEVKKAKVPMLFIHGETDSFVPCDMVYKLYDSCASEKDILVIKGAGHANSIYKDPELYYKKIEEFLKGKGVK